MAVDIEPFFDPDTSTFSYLVSDAGECAVIDPVLGYDPRAGRLSTAQAEAIVARIAARGLAPRWLLETHVHADHLSAAAWFEARLGGTIAIGERVVEVLRLFERLFAHEGTAPFGRLLADGERLALGEAAIEVLHTPGHTPACVSYRVDDAVFVGDALFMPDVGTARCDFPGGDARALYRSMQRLLALPADTRLHFCHDYPPSGRGPSAWATVAAERAGNVDLRAAPAEDAFVACRKAADRGLSVPALLWPAVQVNLCAGRLPPAEANGVRYLKVPLDAF